MLRSFLLVGIGGAAGSLLRYAASLLMHRPAQGTFPAATFAVNLAGCLPIGLLAGFTARGNNWMGSTGWPLLATGLCGGFTTFSAFSLDVLKLYQGGAHLTALAYILLSVIMGILLCYAGYSLSVAKG